MRTVFRGPTPKKSLLRLDRTLHLIDVENLCGTPAFTEDDLIEIQRRYTDLVPIGPSDLVVLAASHFRSRELMFGWTDARHLLRSGPDGADRCLLDVIYNEGIETRFSRVVVGSGDGIFRPACDHLKRHQLKVTVVSRNLRSMALSLQSVVSDVRSLGRPDCTHPGPSRRIKVEPLKRLRPFPDRADPTPRRKPASPPPPQPVPQPVER